MQTNVSSSLPSGKYMKFRLNLKYYSIFFQNCQVFQEKIQKNPLIFSVSFYLCIITKARTYSTR